jgi:hypothetical protein
MASASEPNGLSCQRCNSPLTGRQRRWCTDPVCVEERTRWFWVSKTYNLSKSQYFEILEHQGNVCGLCGDPFKEGQTPHIDHDHKTGYVRGIVHAYCNVRLLHKLRDWKTAQKVADYLRVPPASTALPERVVAPGRPPKRRKRRARK